MQDNGYYSHLRKELLPLIPEKAKRILEVGCGEGLLGEFLIERGAEMIVGIEKDPDAAQKARSRLTHVLEKDVESLSFSSRTGFFDVIICADVLEHLIDPWSLLKRLTSCLTQDGCLVASIPNSRYLALINHLVEGHWTYDPNGGLMDRTHLRFFTLSEIKRMFSNAGLSIKKLHGNMGPLYAEFKDQTNKREIRIGRFHIENLNIEEFNEFFVFQYLVQATKYTKGT